jgi:DNA-binding NtrC family response regulator
MIVSYNNSSGSQGRPGHPVKIRPTSLGRPNFVPIHSGKKHADLHEEVLALVERLLLLEVLQHTGGNQSQAARILGITRPTLRAKLAARGLSINRFGSLGEAELS